jgi:hypothetical protein
VQRQPQGQPIPASVSVNCNHMHDGTDQQQIDEREMCDVPK